MSYDDSGDKLSNRIFRAIDRLILARLEFDRPPPDLVQWSEEYEQKRQDRRREELSAAKRELGDLLDTLMAEISRIDGMVHRLDARSGTSSVR